MPKRPWISQPPKRTLKMSFCSFPISLASLSVCICGLLISSCVNRIHANYFGWGVALLYELPSAVLHRRVWSFVFAGCGRWSSGESTQTDFEIWSGFRHDYRSVSSWFPHLGYSLLMNSSRLAVQHRVYCATLLPCIPIIRYYSSFLSPSISAAITCTCIGNHFFSSVPWHLSITSGSPVPS